MTEPSRLTPAELDLVQDRQFFPAKARLTAKVTEWLKGVHVRLQADLNGLDLLVPPDFDPAKAHFVKGEHLEDHPYQYLDFPKHFGGGNTFTIRTLVWWGHHVTIALLLEGEQLAGYKQNLLARYHAVADRGLHLSLGPTFWEWKRGEGFALPVTRERRPEVAAILSGRSLFKLSRVFPFDDPLVTEGRLPDAAHETLQAFLPVVKRA
jgi:hypothetical protein